MFNTKEIVFIVITAFAYALFMIIRANTKRMEEMNSLSDRSSEENELSVALNKIFYAISKGTEITEEEISVGIFATFGVIMTKVSDKNIKTHCVITIEKSNIDKELYIVAEFKHNGNLTSATIIRGKTEYVEAFKEIHKIYQSFQPESMSIGNNLIASRME